MNHDPDDNRFENLLRDLTPAAPSTALSKRVDEELKLDMNWLQTNRRPHHIPQWLASAGWAALGAAAAIVVMSHLAQQAPTEASVATTTPAVLPVSTIREWEDVQDEGIHYNPQHLPEQHVTLIARERQTWIDPRDGAQMIVEYPREQKLVLPISFQ
ncbi:hypothetical protein [Prosthecobacter sp.]|uniref:hypothetical protein n=1 Tax=Prosthecobacter sp. TaxID=1965333 RepID=UPI001DF3CDE1|nr:hypothetical protein [Prosthecobacter sp.]MCB1277880.1 hypothetical protein [Prosthecobacter sp.]